MEKKIYQKNYFINGTIIQSSVSKEEILSFAITQIHYFLGDHRVIDFNFSQHIVTKLHAVNYILKTQFCQFVFLISFTMMHMFVHCIYTRYIDAHIHQGLNLRPHLEAHQGFNQ